MKTSNLPTARMTMNPLISRLAWPTLRAFCAGLISALMLLGTGPARAVDAQRTFATPQAAVEALAAALQAPGYEALLDIFGRQYKDLIQPDDQAVADVNKQHAATVLKDYWVLREDSPNHETLLLGFDAWPFPIPLVREQEHWRFATEQGADEILNRRIGANEHNAIHVVRAYVGAQREYAAEDRMGDGVFQYARKIGSSPGKQDGLYWPADPEKGEEASPFGPLVAEAGAYLKGHRAGDGYRGYRFKVLTRQGAKAPGGAYSYLINGRMIAGFALLAYPAEYGETGIMSFIVSQSGKVFQKDLGSGTASAASAMKSYDPGHGWELVTD